jgi:hypothetical protein
MRDIIRRKNAVSVQARRVSQTPEPGPEVIKLPSATPTTALHPGITPGASSQPNIVQNFIYVNVATPAPVPPPAAGPSNAAAQPSRREVHYHTTNVYHAPRRPRLGKDVSFLGSLGVVLGGLALGAGYVSQIDWLVKPLAAGGFGLAVLGYLLALLLGRVGRGMPVLGMLACAAAYGLWLKNTGQPIALPKLDLNLSPLAQVVPAVRVLPAAPAPATPPAAIDIENIRDEAAARMRLDYQSARSTALRADAEYERAKQDDPMGSAELFAAGQKHLQADSALTAILQQLRTDPAVAAAEAATSTRK